MITGKEIREGEHLANDTGRKLMEMAILDKSELGFHFFAYCSPEQGAHGPRVKFASSKADLKTNHSFSVSIGPHPLLVVGTPPDHETLARAILWVAANHVVLARFWNDPAALTTRDFLAALKPI